MKKERKIPMRKCLGCSENKAKKDLLRIVKNKEGEIFIDATGKANGRGAYICYDSECLKKAEKSKALNKAFRQNIDKEIMNTLEESINNLLKP